MLLLVLKMLLKNIELSLVMYLVLVPDEVVKVIGNLVLLVVLLLF